MTTRLIIEPPYREALRAAGLDSFDAFMRAPGIGPPASIHRTRETVVLRIAGGAGAGRLFLKRTFRVPRSHVWRDLLRRRRPRCQPWREWEALGLLAAAGIPVPRRVAVGERRSGGLPTAGFVLMEASDCRRHLADWLGPDPTSDCRLSPAARHRLLAEVGRLHGVMRQRGFLWPDARPSHVLAEPEPAAPGGWRFCLIDVERVTVAAVDRPEFVMPLEKLLRRCLPFEPTRFEQLAFWSGHLASRRNAFLAGGVRTAALLAPHSHGAAIHLMPTARDNVRMVKAADGLLINERDADVLRAARLDSTRALLNCRDGRVLGKRGLASHRQRLRIELGDGPERAVYYLKRVVRPPLREQVARLWRGRAADSSAWREWHFIRRLTEIGVPTMRCAALADDVRRGWERQSVLLTAEVPGQSLERWLPEHWPSLPRDRRRALIEQVAAVARLMHAGRLYHRDFYTSHLFVSWDSDGRPLVHVIDLARMLERPARPWRWQIKDLAALHYSTPAVVGRTDRVRFLRRYAPWVEHAARGRSRHGLYRALAVAVIRRAQRMRRHDLSRSRRAAGEAR